MNPFVDAKTLAASDAQLCDVRWYPDGRPGRAAYEEAHIAGAVYVDLTTDLAGPATAPDGTPNGLHPLPAPAVFTQNISRLGLEQQRPVIAYDDIGGMAAARLVWMLRATGHDAAVLDGGLRAWTDKLARGTPKRRSPAPFASKAYPQARLAALDDVRQHVRSGGLLIDAGTPARYRGESLSIHSRSGHIPGAHNLTWTGSVDDSTGKLLPIDVLRSRFGKAGISDAEDIIVYCGSGIAACHLLLVIEHAGIVAGRLFPGSWSQWSADSKRPVATGVAPGLFP